VVLDEPVDLVEQRGDLLHLVDDHDLGGGSREQVLAQRRGLLGVADQLVGLQQVDPDGARVGVPEEPALPRLARTLEKEAVPGAGRQPQRTAKHTLSFIMINENDLSAVSAAPPHPPRALTLEDKAKTPSAVMLDYIDVSLVETGFDLEQRRAGGTWQVIATFAPLGGTFVTGSHKVTGLEPRTEYCFRLVAFNALGDSAPNEICVLTTCAGACEEDKLVEVLEPAAYPNHEVEIDCDLYLEPQNFVFKKLVFIGSRGSGRTVDLNGATLAGGDGTQNDGKDMIEVRSEEVVERNVENDISSYARPSNTTIRNGTVYGSIRLWGMAKNGEGGEKGVIRH
jgi:hypothetical protein